ncbi:DNA-deoxyinosine glycosylase [Facklamia sp. 7083-14-GEN3]|uniref:DNA-deoxyinosine glycosylase n=1 Tax=Facklamia sp. 7083-14-GEN3 TaxID=2973478 RepID=UPI00215C17A0|nr:DNA-deoxyinosine glycosylase [Facklamia sp. 7083-14-GEN3]MCR8968405.1 DNA-deoxyinosine glycosylase [Facklamia sp. 7083-14-GEN3]
MTKDNKQDYQTIKHPLQPLYNEDSQILILGSFPSVKTRQYGFFYGHPQNRFWPLMGNLFKVELSTNIEERRNFLLKHRISVYDSIYQCDIVGSSDASIKNVIPSDLKVIFDKASIQQVFCNGATSYKYYQKYHAKETGIKGIKLPSTSPANARFRLDDLALEWKEILKYLD